MKEQILVGMFNESKKHKNIPYDHVLMSYRLIQNRLKRLQPYRSYNQIVFQRSHMNTSQTK